MSRITHSLQWLIASSFLLFSLSSVGQSLPSAPTATQSDTRSQSEQELHQEMQQRMLGVVPAFTTVYNGHAAPLNTHQKFRLWVADTADPFDFAAAGVDAALEQRSHEFPAYGYGVTGYSKRYGASYIDDADGTLFAEAILPSLLHQDPRYFRLGAGSIIHRLDYTLLSAVRCRGDNFHWQPNISLLGGNLIGGAISNVYYPSADRGFGLTMERGLTVTGEDLLNSLATEFYPDISHALFHHKRRHDP